jgi:hypothetical protein
MHHKSVPREYDQCNSQNTEALKKKKKNRDFRENGCNDFH